MRPAESFTFGSVSGTTFAFFFFLCMALFIGFAIYELLRNPAARRFGGSPATRRTALIAGAALALAVFLAVYFSSLNGFYRLEVREDEFRMVFILPGRTRILQRGDIAGITSRPAYKTLWQLLLRTRSGDEFASARSDLARVRLAQQRLAPLLGAPR
jgi:hypothetical protein